MKLYTLKRAPNPRRVHIFLAEKGLDIPLKEMDMATREQKSDVYLAKNPMGQVPMLELDDGTCIAEAPTICRYLEELHPEPSLLGKTPAEHALVDMWQRRIETLIYEPSGNVLRTSPEFAKRAGVEPIPEWSQRSRDKVEENFSWLDGHLSQHSYIALGRFTAADIALICGIGYAGLGRMRIPDECTQVQGWYDRMGERPSVQAFPLREMK